MKQAIRTIIIVFIVYVSISFVVGDYNALKWTEEQRFVSLLLVASIHILYYMKKLVDNIGK
jgi:hypothetical protein